MDKKLLKDLKKSHGLWFFQVWKLRKSPIAQLLAKAPYMVKCENPERMSFVWVSLFISGQKLKLTKSIRFDSKPTDYKNGLWSRFEPVLTCETGDQDILNKIKRRILLVSLADHRKDYLKDKKSNKYNPLPSVTLSGEITKLQKEKSIPEIDETLPVSYASRGLWN